MNQTHDLRPLRLGFIGGGLSSCVGQTHFAASQLDGRWQLAAGVFSRRTEVNRATAAAWNVPSHRVYSNWTELIERECGSLDAVVVLTPTPHHFEVLPSLLDAGIPILCEKSLVSGLDQVNALKGRFRPTRNFLAVTFNYSGYPMVRALRERIERGDLGRIHQLQFEMPQEGFVRPPPIAGRWAPPQHWRLRDAFIPTICLDLGVHLHHLATFLTGEEPASVFAEFNTYSTYADIVDNADLWLRYPSGMTARFWASKTAIGNRNGLRLRVFGEDGSAEWYQLNPEELQLRLRNGVRMVIDRSVGDGIIADARYHRMKAGHPSGFVEAFANLYTDLADALLNWKTTGRRTHPYVYGLDHAADGLSLFHAARCAYNDGQWTDLNEMVLLNPSLSAV